MDVHITLVAALGRRREIGADGKMLWHISRDLRLFKQLTLGKPVIMGRVTFESLGGKPLPGRTNVVLSRKETENVPAGVHVVSSPDSALRTGLRFAGVHVVSSLDSGRTGLRFADTGGDKSPEIMIIGGGQVYRQFMARADRLYLTHVDAMYAGADTYFPAWHHREWEDITNRMTCGLHETTQGLRCRFQALRRRRSADAAWAAGRQEAGVR